MSRCEVLDADVDHHVAGNPLHEWLVDQTLHLSDEKYRYQLAHQRLLHLHQKMSRQYLNHSDQCPESKVRPIHIAVVGHASKNRRKALGIETQTE